MTALHPEDKRTKRGFVMTGGGAKGLFEAGVIHAFHLCGMEFDVITGSSIGAINSIFYAEYQMRKQQLPAEVLADPAQVVEAMDALVWAFLHAWWDMPRMGIIDDSAAGPLGLIKDDLQELNISLAALVRIAWWYSNPNNDWIADAQVLNDITNLVSELPERIEGGRGLLEIWKRLRDDKVKPMDAAIRTYLNRFGMEHALVPDDKSEKLKEFFTQSITPLRTEHLDDPDARLPLERVELLIPAGRTLRDFKEAGIDVRLTRTNFRTGRLEVSAYHSADQFGAFLNKHWFRFNAREGLLPALGNARLQMVGNPNAVYAALASGRFPGVFSPLPVTKIYDMGGGDPDNALFASLLGSWLNDDRLRAAMTTAPVSSGRRAADISDNLMDTWRESQELSRLFPKAGDHYVDGGAIDNTPTNSAIDAVKEYADEHDIGYRDVRLDLYTIFLHPPPDPRERVSEMLPSSIETVRRTMEIRTAAVLSSDAAHVRFINKTSQLGEETTRAVIDLVEAMQQVLTLPEDSALGLSDEQREALQESLRQRIAAALPENENKSIEEKLEEIKDDHRQIIDWKLPLHVNPIEIHPEEMPMRTLQFTERLGYRPHNAIRMMTSGCYSTLWSLFVHLAGKSRSELDERDESTLKMARHWMGLEGDELPDATPELQRAWRCRRVQCVFHARHCRHGARPDEAW
ncbi:MAG: patatin-like phospholipase family protein [Candidatus Promineofilum sp.]|nr:patatin-like phospholipase family protein [Promineifilum sp.]